MIEGERHWQAFKTAMYYRLIEGGATIAEATSAVSNMASSVESMFREKDGYPIEYGV